MKLRILYFILGALFAFTAGIGVYLWISYHEYQAEELGRRLQEVVAPAPPVLQAADLTGRWRGEEGWGITYVITRNKDGTFTEVDDLNKSDGGYSRKTGAIVKSKGRWSLHGGMYSVCYTESTEPSMVNGGPWAATIYPESRTVFHYLIDEGNGITERKQ